MKMKELALKEVGELNALLNESRKKLDDLKFKIHQGQLKDVREVRIVKKEIARVLTALKMVNKK